MTALMALAPQVTAALGWTLIHFVWQATVIAAALGFALQLIPRRFAKTRYVAGDDFSYGDIPVAIMVYRYRQLVPERPPLPEMERWYAEVSGRQAFKDHVGAVPLT